MSERDEIAKLTDSLKICRLMIKHAGNAIFSIDPDTGDIVDANLKAEQMTAYSESELTAMKVWDLHPEDQKEAAKRLFHRVVTEGKGDERDMSFERKDGRVVQVDVSASVIEYGGKRVIQRICKDITERVRLREELARANEDLEHKVEERTREVQEKQALLVHSEKMAALGSLVAGVAHEINTPLGAIQSNNDIFIRTFDKIRVMLSDAAVLTDQVKYEELREKLDAIDKLNAVSKTATERIVSIVNSLRNFARLEEAEQKDADLHEGLESTLTLVHHQLKGRIEVVRRYGDIPLIRCLPNQLNQVFMNLLVNASQAIEGKGKITVSTGRSSRKETVFVEISDTGKGIPPENLARIFDPGFTTKGAGVGTGLGLSIVYQIVKDHNGEVEVESEVGKGSTFRVLLPVRR